MLEIGRIRLTVFAYITEENDRVIHGLKNCLPPDLHKLKIEKNGTQSQFGDPLVIYSFETEDNSHIDSILSHFGENLDPKSKNYFERNLSMKIDFENRMVYFRIDKFKAYLGELTITEGSDVIRVEISYNAYTQAQNSFDQVKNTLVSYEILET